MNNRPTLFTRIRNIIVGTIMPKYLEDLWLDVSNGEKKAVLKYKGNPLVGGSSGGSGSDYQSSGSVVKDMIEQGTNFNWAKYAIDITSLPCFDQKKVELAIEKAVSWQEPMNVEDILSEGYVLVNLKVGRLKYSLVVKQTGDNPSVSGTPGSFVFVDCEPVNVLKVEQVIMGRPNLPILPVRSLLYDVTDASEPIPVHGAQESFDHMGLAHCTVEGNDNFLYLAFERESAA